MSNRTLKFAGHVLALALNLMPTVRAELPDEIQVYDDSINAPGEKGLELHINRTAKGRSIPAYSGELPPNRGTRLTPELSYGLSEQWEAGLYLPAVRDPDGRWSGAGFKARLKWMGQRSASAQPWFFGANIELAWIPPRFDESRWGAELRPIWGYRSADWLFVTNPILHYSLSPGQRKGGVDFTPAFKVSRKLSPGLDIGLESYSDLGKLSAITGRPSHTLFWVVDVDRGPWVFNAGIGRGLTADADRWTVKAIFELPLSF